MTPTTEGNETFRSLSGNSNVALPLSSNQRLVNRPRLLHWHLMERKTLTDFKPVQEMWEITSNWYYKSAVTSESWGCEWSWKCFWFYIQWIHREETPFVVLFFNTWTKCPTDLSWYKKKNAQKKNWITLLWSLLCVGCATCLRQNGLTTAGGTATLETNPPVPPHWATRCSCV